MTKEIVVLVHGLWMNGLDMSILSHRLEHAGYDTRRFSYRSVRAMPLQNAMDLNSFTGDIKAPVVHFLCHSLGGLVIRHLFHEYPDQRPGRIVTLGTPHQPSSTARSLVRYPPFRLLLGKSVVSGLLGKVPDWNGNRELGSIAGDMRLGMGMFTPNVVRPNDGTVTVPETMLDGMKDHVVIHASHFGLLISRRAADQSVHFLENGRFRH